MWEAHGASATSDGARQAMLQSVQALLQKTSEGCPDRAETRSCVCGALAALLLKLPTQAATSPRRVSIVA